MPKAFCTDAPQSKALRREAAEKEEFETVIMRHGKLLYAGVQSSLRRRSPVVAPRSEAAENVFGAEAPIGERYPNLPPLTEIPG